MNTEIYGNNGTWIQDVGREIDGQPNIIKSGMAYRAGLSRDSFQNLTFGNFWGTWKNPLVVLEKHWPYLNSMFRSQKEFPVSRYKEDCVDGGKYKNFMKAAVNSGWMPDDKDTMPPVHANCRSVVHNFGVLMGVDLAGVGERAGGTILQMARDGFFGRDVIRDFAIPGNLIRPEPEPREARVGTRDFTVTVNVDTSRLTEMLENVRGEIEAALMNGIARVADGRTQQLRATERRMLDQAARIRERNRIPPRLEDNILDEREDDDT